MRLVQRPLYAAPDNTLVQTVLETMGSKLVIACLALSMLAGAVSAEENVATTPGRPPNIVLIFTDDLGYADITAYGHPYAVTPNLDRLAAEGALFRQHYVTGPVCVPSRTGLMTGVDPARFEKDPKYDGFSGRETVTGMLGKHGYVTGHFGKWHIGPPDTEHDGTYGIDKVVVTGPPYDDPEGRDADVFRAAIGFIRENADKPFYVNIWTHSPHFPVKKIPKYMGMFSELKVNRADFSSTMQPKFDKCLQLGCDLDTSMATYLAEVYSIDVNVGRIMNLIDELGLRDDTIVVFSSDNGPAPVRLDRNREKLRYSHNMLGYAGILRGGKHSLEEGGIRVPFIIRWPGKIEAGRVDTDSVTSFIDWLPTLGALAGVETLPNDLDGENISDIWLSDSRARTTPLFWKTFSENAPAAMREGKWKLYVPNLAGAKPELYDLVKDPGESQNVAGQYTDVMHRMSKELQAWRAELPERHVRKTKRKHKSRSRVLEDDD